MKTSTRPPILSAQQWRAAVKEGTVGGLSRQVPSAIARGADGAVAFIASTPAPDRYGDTIDQNGWDTSSYEKNPVLLWAHSYSTPPVGKVLKLVKNADALRADAVEFTPKEVHAFGAEVGAMVREGFLNTVSVGFLPKSWEERYGETGNFLGYHFKEMELLEISVVPVPANPQALVDGRAFVKSLAEWASATETPDADVAPVARSWGDQLRSWLKAADDAQVRLTQDSDDADFRAMLSCLERIAVSSERTEKALGELLTITRASSGLASESRSVDAADDLTLSEALALLSRG